MPRIFSFWSKAAAAILVAAFAFYVWRAATLSITTDEAFTCTRFVMPPWLQILTTYDANHHFLHSYLCKVVTSVLGISPFALRIPALAGSALYLWGAWRLTRSLCGDSPVMPALCALMAFHPGLLDYLSLARGYSLALGLLLYALAETEEGRWSRVSLALGLSVAANAVFILPAAAWIAVMLVSRRLWNQADALIAPGAVAALILVAVPVTYATAGNFYFGTATLFESMETVFIYPVTLIVVLAAAVFERGRLTLTLALIVAGLAALHLIKGIPWPRSRTGCYLIPLAILLVGHACARWRWSAAPLAAGSAFCIAVIHPGYTTEWQFDANNREVFAYLEERYPISAIAADPPLFHSMEYYRRLRGLTKMPPIVEIKPADPAAVNVLMTAHPNLREVIRFQPSGVHIDVR